MSMRPARLEMSRRSCHPGLSVKAQRRDSFSLKQFQRTCLCTAFDFFRLMITANSLGPAFSLLMARRPLARFTKVSKSTPFNKIPTHGTAPAALQITRNERSFLQSVLLSEIRAQTTLRIPKSLPTSSSQGFSDLPTRGLLTSGSAVSLELPFVHWQEALSKIFVCCRFRSTSMSTLTIFRITRSPRFSVAVQTSRLCRPCPGACSASLHTHFQHYAKYQFWRAHHRIYILYSAMLLISLGYHSHRFSHQLAKAC